MTVSCFRLEGEKGAGIAGVLQRGGPPLCNGLAHGTLPWATRSPGPEPLCAAERVPKARVLHATSLGAAEPCLMARRCHQGRAGLGGSSSGVSPAPAEPVDGASPLREKLVPSNSWGGVPPPLKAQEDSFGVAPFSLCLYLLLISSLFSHTSTLNSFGFSF